jgi:hypothetical protein
MAMVRNSMEEKLRRFGDQIVAMFQMCSFNTDKTDITIVGRFVKRCLSRKSRCIEEHMSDGNPYQWNNKNEK